MASNNQKQLVFEIQLVHKDTGRTKTVKGVGGNYEQALADAQGRYGQYRVVSAPDSQAIGQRVETTTATEGKRATTRDIVSVDEAAGRRLVDKRSAEDIANEKANSQAFKAAGGLGVAKKDETTGAITNRNTGQSFVPASGNPVNTDLMLRPGETPDQYKSRVSLNSTLNVGNLGGASQMNFPNAPVPNTTADTATAGATAYSTQYDSAIKAAQKEEAKNQKSYDQLSSEISKLLGTTTGRGEAQLDAEAQNNVPGLQNQLNDINNQIKVGLAEYAQLQNTYDKISAENKNRPVTMDSIIGSERAINEKRVLELNGKAADIGLLQAQAQGLQGSLEQAQKTADRAVDLKYADATALINVKIQQLDMIRDSLTASEKKTAVLLDRQYQAERDQIELQKANQKDLNAALLNAMSDYRDAGITLNDTIESANAKIVANSRIYAKQVSSGSGSGVSNQQIDNERALFTSFRGEPIVKDYNTILAKKLSVDSIISSGVGGPGELALVYEFMKALDPTSVVRETEYASAAKSGNIFAGSFAKFNGYLKENGGFLPPATAKSFQSIIDSKLKVQQKLYDNVASEYSSLAERQGLDPNNVVIGYSNPSNSSSQQTNTDPYSAYRSQLRPGEIFVLRLGKPTALSSFAEFNITTDVAI